MMNHFHLQLETPLGNLGEFMRHFNITYTSHYNRRHQRSGHLYQGRYKSVLVDRETIRDTPHIYNEKPGSVPSFRLYLFFKYGFKSR
jgi:hypothetical protein